MARRTVVTMPGDGIGKVVLPEALRVLEAVGFEVIAPNSPRPCSRRRSTVRSGSAFPSFTQQSHPMSAWT